MMVFCINCVNLSLWSNSSTCRSKQSLLLQSDRQQLFKQMLQSDRQQMSKLSDSARAPKKSQNKQSKASGLCARQLHEGTNVHSSQSVPKHIGHATVENSVGHAEASRSEATLVEKEMLTQTMQLKELISQLIVDQRRRDEVTPSPSDDTKKTEHYFECSVSADKENEYPSRQLNGRKQLKITNRNVDSERELSRERQKLTSRDTPKENCYHRQRRSDRRRDEFSPSPSGYTKKSSHRYERSFSHDGYCSDSEDEENESPTRWYDSGKQAKAMDHKADSNYELFCKFLKFTGRDSSKGNDIPDTPDTPDTSHINTKNGIRH